MSLKKNIYIPIEIKVREFVPKVFFAHKAAKKNYRIYIGSKNRILEIIEKKEKKGGVFFYKGGLNKNASSLIKKKCDLFAIMDEEIVPNMQKYMYRMSDQSFFSYIIKNRLEQNNVDKYYTSNKEINNAAKKVLSNKTFSLSTGNLKIDLWKDKNLDLYAAKKKIIKKKFKNFIIFNSDIRYLHNKNDFEDNFDLDVYKSLKKDSRFIKKEMSSLKRFSKFKNKNFLFLIKLLNNIDKNLKKIKLIIRPHPTEDINIWRIVTKNLKNIEISPPTDDVIPYILASKGVIHNGCTTSNASICLNKPTGYLIDNSNKYNKDYIVKNKLKYCFKISNSQDFIYWLNNLNKYKPLNDKNKRNFFKKMNIQKESVSDLVIKDLSNSQIFKEKKIYIPKENMNYFSEFLFKMKSIIKKTLYMKKKRFYISKIPSAITHLEANKYIKILDKNDKRKEKTLIRQVKNNLIEIECS